MPDPHAARPLLLISYGDDAVSASMRFFLEAHGLAVLDIAYPFPMQTHPSLNQGRNWIINDNFGSITSWKILQDLRELGYKQPAIITSLYINPRRRHEARQLGAVLVDPFDYQALVFSVSDSVLYPL